MFLRRKILIFLVVVLFVIFIFIQLPSSKEEEPSLSDQQVDFDDSPSENHLLNLTNFQYLINPSEVCQRVKPLLGIIIVTSYVGHDDVRSAHRKGISQSELQQLGLARIFLLAAIPISERFITQNAVISEHRRYGDLLQGNFLENYRNLTYKHVMGLKWAAQSCAHAKFIIKIDDDSVYDVLRVAQYLRDHEQELHTQNFLAGYVFNHQKPIRLEADKHFVTLAEYSEDEFPKYLSGWLYLTNPQTARIIVTQSEKKRFFWIDDTYVTGILVKDQPIQFHDLSHWFSANSDFFDCCLRDLKLQNLKCEYLVGPNGGDTQLLARFQSEARKCFSSNICRDRQGEAQNIRNTCVTEYKDLLRKNHGSAIVRHIKL